MKSVIKKTMLALLISTHAFAETTAVVTPGSDYTSTEALQQENIFDQVTRRSGTYVKGRGVALMSDRHVDLDTRIHYQKINNKIRFTMATNGNNWHMCDSHILFPASGDVVFEVLNKDQMLIEYKFMGEKMYLAAEEKTLYIVENNEDYARRMEAIDLYNAGQRENSAKRLSKTGKMIAKVTYDLFDHQIDVFEVTSGNVLKQTGSFKGLFQRAR